jgi:hypothetical protein
MLAFNGKFKWMKKVSSTGFANVRGAGGDTSGYVYATGVLTEDSKIGNTTSVKGYPNGSTFLAKFATSTGDVIWARVLGNTETDTAGELTTFGKDQIAITSSNKGLNYNLYDRLGNLLTGNVFVTKSTDTRSTLAIFNSSGSIVAVHEPTATDASTGGVLTFSNSTATSTCLVYQNSIHGKITFDNGDTYTSTGSTDKDEVLMKVCY